MSKKHSKKISSSRQTGKRTPKNTVSRTKSLEGRIVNRVRYCVENNIKLDTPNLTPKETIQMCQQKLSDLLFYHYYLIFVQEMIDSGVLLSFTMQYNVKTATMRIRNIGEVISRLPKLNEEEAAFHIELAYVAEETQKIAISMYEEIERASKFSKWIDSMVLARSKFLPIRENEPEMSNEQVYAEVIRITAINYLANKVFSIGFPKQPMEKTLDLPKDYE